jgi:uncharacterized protein (TIGR02588 family)
MPAVVDDRRPPDTDASSSIRTETVDSPPRDAAADSTSRRDAVRGKRPQDARTNGQSAGSERSSAEWVTLAVSSLIVLGLIAVTTYFYLTASDAPVAVQVEPRMAETYRVGDRFYLPISVRNRGGQTGTDVRVRVSLTGSDGRQESAEVLVNFLAGGGTSKAVVSFGSDPRQGQLEAGVTSYLEP